MFVGWSTLTVGRPRTAVEWLGGAVAGLDSGDPTGWLRLCRAQLAHAQVLLGEQDTAGRTMQDVAAVTHPATLMFEPHVLLARAWHAVGEHRHAEGITLAHHAADFAGGHGNAALELAALHTAVRLGGGAGAVRRLRELAVRMDGDLVTVCLEHAEAAAAGDGPRLDEVARRWEDMGSGLRAAEAFAQAATGHLHGDAPHAAARSTARATRIARESGAANAPSIRHLGAPSLTRREHEVAVLAALDLSNRTIAGRLGCSVRTVEAHLASVYTKLGLHRRGELGPALAGPAPGSAGAD